MNTEVKGKIVWIGETQNISDSFKKREFAVKTDGDYPQTILIQLTQDRVDLLNTFVEGAGVEVSVNLRGREWVNPEGVTKYFNSIEGWKVQAVALGKPEAQPVEEVEDDLPF